MTRPALRSLRLRLFFLLLGLAALAALAVAAATYASVRAEADELFDYHLRQVALSLRDQGRIPEDERAVLANTDFDYLVQIWSVDGLEIYSNGAARQEWHLPPRTVLGFSNIEVGSSTWRVFGAATPLRIIQVAQPLTVRRQLAAAAAGRSVLPIMVAAPLVGLAMWWLVGVSLAPLKRVLLAARQRDPHSLAPLPADDLPTEVAPLVGAFNALLHRLDQAFVAQRHFVADAAHELRTPLTALKLQISLLQGASSEQERAVALGRLRAGVDRAAHQVEQLLALARAEPGHQRPMVTLDLAEVARQAVADTGPLAQARGARVTLDAPTHLPFAGLADDLRGLLRNLVENAIKHAGDAPRVQVQVQVADGQVLLTVEDDGPGIPEDERERAFARFHRRQGQRSEGTGLGLAIARAVASLHGGQVSLQASPLGGLRAMVRLPLPAGPSPLAP